MVDALAARDDRKAHQREPTQDDPGAALAVLLAERFEERLVDERSAPVAERVPALWLDVVSVEGSARSPKKKASDRAAISRRAL